jgi:hypothetical protein
MLEAALGSAWKHVERDNSCIKMLVEKKSLTTVKEMGGNV